MIKQLLLVAFFLAPALYGHSQFLQTIIEIQGEEEVSPYEGQIVTFNAMVTEAFGDFWYMQDAYGEWNGVLVIEPDLLVPANPPYWSSERQPEVGDELTLTGTVVEVDGNTQVTEVSLVEQTEFWLATPVGIEVDHISSQSEALEGGRVRVYSGTVAVSPDENDEWTLSDGTGEIQCIGLDDEVDFNVGDVYDVYGALREFNGTYKIQVSDVDLVSVGITESESPMLIVGPIPMSTQTTVRSNSVMDYYRLYSITGEEVQNGPIRNTSFELERNGLTSGSYVLKVWGGDEVSVTQVVVQ